MISALYGLSVCLGILPLLLLAWWRCHARNPMKVWIFVLFGLIVLDSVATLIPYEFHLNPDFFQANWIGKALSIAWALLFIILGPLSTREVGIARQRARTCVLAWSIAVAAVAACAIGDWLSGPLKPTAQMMLYQLTMPALAEETVYRGILLAVLSRAFREDAFPSRFHLGWSVWITATAFALVHGLQISHDQFHFQLLACLFPFAFGIVAGWLRKYSGSLLLPVMLHSGIDFAAAAVGLL